MKRKNLSEPPARPELTLEGNRARLSRSLRTRNRLDAAALSRPVTLGSTS